MKAIVILSILAQSVMSVTPASSAAQSAYASPQGRVEVLGLRRWTLSMLRDSIRHYVPGQDLHDAACVVTLRDSLHFAEASVEHFQLGPPGQPPRSFLSIKVVEPEQVSRIQWDARPRNEFSSLLPDYAPFVVPVTDSTGGVWRGRLLFWIQLRTSADRQSALSRAPVDAKADGDRAFAFLDSRRGEADRVRAMRVMASDAFWVNRMAAVAVLSNFPANDSTWWALVQALRDPHEAVREAAFLAVGRAMPARPIDWRASQGDLRLLLGGTNLQAMPRVFELLAATSVAPELAPVLLKDNADWVLDHLGAEAPGASYLAHRLLVRLNAGRDLGPSRSAWATWVSTL